MGKMPTEGVVGEGLDDDWRCRMALQHLRESGPDFVPTAAEAARIERGKQLELAEEFT